MGSRRSKVTRPLRSILKKSTRSGRGRSRAKSVSWKVPLAKAEKLHHRRHSKTFSSKDVVGLYLQKKLRQSGENSKLHANYKKDKDAGKRLSDYDFCGHKRDPKYHRSHYRDSVGKRIRYGRNYGLHSNGGLAATRIKSFKDWNKDPYWQ